MSLTSHIENDNETCFVSLVPRDLKVNLGAKKEDSLEKKDIQTKHTKFCLVIQKAKDCF